MDKVLLDSSTFFDISRASRNQGSDWARRTLSNFAKYQRTHEKVTVSEFTIFEHLDGLHRQGKTAESSEFRSRIVPTLEVIYPDEPIVCLAARIHAHLATTGQMIGIADIFIAATAIEKGLPLFNANTRHFSRVTDAGFSLTVQNWREP